MTAAATRLRRLLGAELGACCDEAVDQRLDELHELAATAFTDDAVRSVFAVLGNETRYRLAHTLVVADEELCVCELEPLVDVSESAVSHALSDLVSAGLVARRKDGNWRYYDATDLAIELFAVNCPCPGPPPLLLECRAACRRGSRPFDERCGPSH